MRLGRFMVGAAVLLLVAAGCTSGGGGETTPTPAASASLDETPVTLQVWGFFTPGSTLDQLDHVFSMFTEQYPWITVKYVPNKEDDKVAAAINGNVPFDIAMLGGADNLGKFCSTGSFVDLNPFIQRDNLDMSQFSQGTTSYTQFEGKQCALPMLTDAYGLYYNKDLLAKASISEPPKTMTELTEDSKKLAEFNPDGSIKVAGYLPWMGFYDEWGPTSLAQAFGCRWFNEDGTSAMATDPCWARAFEWQKSLVDWYGVDKIVEYIASIQGEWSSRNAFHVGQVALMYDGEWRIDSIADGANPDLNYATAPYSVADDRADAYGSGTIGGTIIAIPKTSEHVEQAWLLEQFLATNTEALVYLANHFSNIPTTQASATSPDLKLDPRFDTFAQIYLNPNSSSPPITTSGSLYGDLTATFMQGWQAGKVPDLQAGLEKLASDIDAQMQLEAGP